MVCAWNELLNILPLWIRSCVDKLANNELQEIRLRLGQPLCLKTKTKNHHVDHRITATDMRYCINVASRYSPWLANTASYGYITAPGGHRIGICGDMHGAAGSVTDSAGISSLCIRVARDYPGVAQSIPKDVGSVLIIGRPGSGKTTLLRDIIRQRSDQMTETVSVVDERGEIFPRVNGGFCFETGSHTDVLTACGKANGIESVLRAMSPDIIAVDEITASEDCQALFHAAWCGVKLIATAHAGNLDDLFSRPLYLPIIERKIFDTVVILDAKQRLSTKRLSL